MVNKRRKSIKSKIYSRHVEKHLAKNVKKLHAFFGITGNANNRALKTAKVGFVIALLGVIFKAIFLTGKFPQQFDTLGNIILFIAFIVMLSSFLLRRF